MCQILVFNAINTIVTDMECNIMIDRLTLGRLSILILPSISVTKYKYSISTVKYKKKRRDYIICNFNAEVYPWQKIWFYPTD